MKKTTIQENIALAVEYAKINAEIKLLEKRKEELKAKIQEVIGEDVTTNFADLYQATLEFRDRTSYDFKKMKTDGIEIDRYQKRTTYLQLKLVSLQCA